ncbi:MAG TPA: DNA/RNA nuclease SfsA [Syntrophorhabdaceae bacterium]|nr:DNA/RNA nuclease SfsA [Syntrophorhabdaceae bacterium]
MGSDIKNFRDFDLAFYRRRLNRFLVECELNGKILTAHLPNPGRLWELLQKGRIIYLREKPSHGIRNTKFMVMAVKKDLETVFLHTHYTNGIARMLIEEGNIPGLEGYKIEKPEFKIGNSRFDFMLKKDGSRMLLEVKSCTLFHNNIAMFPDAVTSRGTRHILGLAESTFSGCVLFIVHSQKPEYFLPEYHIDPEFSETLYSLRNKILIKAVAISWNKDLTFKNKTKELDIPWHVYERESRDRGSYVLILNLNCDKSLSIGGLGKIFFRKGYYLYVGSAMKNLNKRLARHKKRNKPHFWHIDYLREEADLIHVIPVRSHKRLECHMASSIKGIADGFAPDFGSSDCNCDSHLFYMEHNPIHDNRFIEVLLDYRMPFIR